MAHWKMANGPDGVRVTYKNLEDGTESDCGLLPRGRLIQEAYEFFMVRACPGDFASVDGETLWLKSAAQDDFPRGAVGFERTFDVHNPGFMTATA